jgi:hypothetical protein
MKKWVGWVLLGVSLVIAYQGYQNSVNDPNTQQLARSIACDGEAKCVLAEGAPSRVQTDIVSRRYEWNSSLGPITTECHRSAVFFGGWSCQSQRGSLESAN